MGKVTEHLIGLIHKQVEEKGIVVWYDPDQAYTVIAQTLTLPETTVLQYTDSFFRLRNEIDSLVEFLDADDKPVNNCGVPPCIVIYVPKERHTITNALIEFEKAGTIMKPGAGTLERNTRLRIVAETVFGKIAPDQVTKIGRQIEEGLLNIAELDKIADEVESVGSAVIKLIFGTTAIEEVVLKFVASTEYDEAVAAKNALPEIKSFFQKVLGIEFSDENDPQSARNALKKHLLMTEFLSAFTQGSRPEALSFIAIPEQETHIDTVNNICRIWRNRADYRNEYMTAARTVEKAIGLSGLEFLTGETCELLAETQTFPVLEQRLIEHCEAQLLSGEPQKALKIAKRRINSFWAIQEPIFQLRWSIIQYCARILQMGSEIRTELKTIAKNPTVIAARYVDAESPWCLLDTYYRHLEHRYALFDLELTGEHENLQRVMALVRLDYTKTLEAGIEKFSGALATADFQIEGYLIQDAVFPKYVDPLLKKKKKTAYILVDALRYEMGRELADGLTEEFKVNLVPAVSLLPSVTSVGMSALMPEADKGMELVQISGDKFAIGIGSVTIKNRSDRLKFIQMHTDAPAVACKLNQLIKPSKKLQNEIKEAEWVVVTSQELDRWGEEANGDDEVRIFMEEVLDKLGKGIRRLAALGMDNIVLAADHGHLFGETIEGGMRMDPPGGETVELHGRVWIGKGGAAGDGYFRVTSSQVGLSGELELAFPRSLACFKTKGGTKAYCHGGISLQEMFVPVITLKHKRSEQSFTKAAVQLEINVPQITNRFFSVSALYQEEGLFGVDEIRVKVIVKSGRKEVGAAAMAAYGFEAATKAISLKKNELNPVTLMLTQVENVKSVSIHVLDAVSQVELGRLKNIPVDIAI